MSVKENIPLPEWLSGLNATGIDLGNISRTCGESEAFDLSRSYDRIIGYFRRDPRVSEKMLEINARTKRGHEFAGTDGLLFGAAAAIEVTYEERIEIMIDFLLNSACDRRWKKPETRGRFAAFYYQTVLRNSSVKGKCHADELTHEASRLSGGKEFDLDTEILAVNSGLIVPMTGSLVNDLQANWVARNACRWDFETALNFTKQCMFAAVHQFCDAVAYGFEPRALLPIVYNLDEDGAKERLLSAFSDDAICLHRKKDRRRNQTDSAYLIAAFIGDIAKAATTNKGTDLLFLTDMLPCALGVGGTPLTASGKGAIDTTLCSPEKAESGHIISALLPPVDVRDEQSEEYDGETYDMASKEWWTDTSARNRLATLHALAPFLEQERAQFFERKKFLLSQKKGATVTVSRQEWDALQKKLSDAEQSDEAMSVVRNALVDANQDINTKKQKIDAQNARIQRLEGELKDAKLQLTRLTARYDELEKAKASIEDDLLAAQQLLDEAAAPAAEECTDELDTSIFDSVRVVIFGGHPNWIRGVRTVHESLRFIAGDDLTPSEDIIARADIVWLQTSFCAHSAYSRIIEIAKKHNKPVEYFKTDGIALSRRTLVERTEEMFGASSLLDEEF